MSAFVAAGDRFDAAERALDERARAERARNAVTMLAELTMPARK